MIDVVQLLLILTVTVLVGLLTVVGLQAYLVLKEFRKTLEKANKVIDDAGVISESVSKPISMASSMLMGFSGGEMIAKWLRKNSDDR